MDSVKQNGFAPQSLLDWFFQFCTDASHSEFFCDKDIDRLWECYRYFVRLERENAELRTAWLSASPEAQKKIEEKLEALKKNGRVLL